MDLDFVLTLNSNLTKRQRVETAERIKEEGGVVFRKMVLMVGQVAKSPNPNLMSWSFGQIMLFLRNLTK